MGAILDVREAAVDVLRDASYHLDPVSGLYVRGTSVEGQATNEWIHSREFDNWGSKVRLSVSSNAIAAPDEAGSVIADKLVPDTNSQSHIIRAGTSFSGISGAPYMLASVFAKAGEYDWIYLDMSATDGASNRIRVWWDVATGALGSQDVTGTEVDLLLHDIVPFKEDWYWCLVAGRPNTTFTETYPFIGVSEQDGSPAMAGDNSKGLYVFQADFIINTQAIHSPIETTTAAVTRAADSAITVGTLPSTDLVTMTIYRRFIYKRSVNSTGLASLSQISSAVPQLWLRLAPNLGRVFERWTGTNPANFGITSGFSPDIGDLVETRTVFRVPGDGNLYVTVGASKNGGVEDVSAEGSRVIDGDVFGNTNVQLMSDILQPYAVLGDDARKQYGLYVEPGVKTMDEMRTLAGWS